MSDRLFARRSLTLLPVALGGLLLAAACSSGGGGPVEGPADNHCAGKSQPTSQSACQGGGTGGGSSGAGGGSSSSAGAGGMAAMSDYGDTLDNAEGDDDDCKYHLKFTSTDIGQNKDVTFTVTVTNKSDGKPTTGAAPEAEVFLSDTHPAPNTDQKPSESADGTYKVGPVRFDAAGKWTVRFHLFETCSDESEESPHGHVAFYINVP